VPGREPLMHPGVGEPPVGRISRLPDTAHRYSPLATACGPGSLAIANQPSSSGPFPRVPLPREEGTGALIPPIRRQAGDYDS